MLGDQALTVGERDREDVRQGARREGCREGRGRPVVFLGVDRDPRILGLELTDLEVQGVGGFLGGAGPQDADGDRDGLVRCLTGCGGAGGALAGRSRAHAGRCCAACAEQGGGCEPHQGQACERMARCPSHSFLSSLLMCRGRCSRRGTCCGSVEGAIVGRHCILIPLRGRRFRGERGARPWRPMAGARSPGRHS